MRIIRDFAACPREVKGAAIALGNFDGVHLGHQAILRHCIGIAEGEGILPAVMTFEPHPREFFSRSSEKLRLYSFRSKAEMLKEMGIKALFVQHFTRQFAAKSPEEFVEGLLHDQLGVRHVITGYNFAFGKNRKGDTAFLNQMVGKLGFEFTACPPVYDTDGAVISSSAIRQLLAEGDMKKAARLLGKPYAICGRVQRGWQRGRDLGFPTANLSLSEHFKPRFGIYAVRASIDGTKTWYDGVASLGINPMFELKEPVLEVHLFDHNESLYGRRLTVQLLGFMREEQRFADMDALRSQIAQDVRKAKSLLESAEMAVVHGH